MLLTLLNEAVYVADVGIPIDHNKPTVIFIHGAGLDHTVWVLFNRFFARNGLNSLAIDLPGHGRSSGQPLKRIEAMADWLIQLIHALELHDIKLVGHSMGSLIALETAGRHQGSDSNRVSTTVLLGTAAPMTVGDSLLQAARDKQPAAVDMIMLAGHAYGSQLGGNPVAGINILNSNRCLLERGLPHTLYTDLNACNDYTGAIGMAANITHKVYLVSGAEDNMTPAKATTDLLTRLAHSQSCLLKHTGHMMLSENPEQVHQLLAEALL